MPNHWLLSTGVRNTTAQLRCDNDKTLSTEKLFVETTISQLSGIFDQNWCKSKEPVDGNSYSTPQPRARRSVSIGYYPVEHYQQICTNLDRRMLYDTEHNACISSDYPFNSITIDQAGQLIRRSQYQSIQEYPKTTDLSKDYLAPESTSHKCQQR